MASLTGKVALVTGSGRGLGQACANLLARDGAKVVIADIDEQTGQAAAAAICAAGGEASFVRADVSSEDSVAAMVAHAVDTFGGLDLAINNAVSDMGRRTPLAEIELADWERLMAVNFTGVFLCMKHEIRAMQARGGGAVVNIGSGNEHTAKAGLSWYLAAKQGIYAMTKCAALDYGEAGIRVNAVAPGPMWTPLLRETVARNPGHAEAHVAHVPLRRICEPEEVAEAAVWLCSPAASFVTGVTLSADGGYVLGPA
jgi:NAD(P)-dependent dehydrogenase (short-subunit alcohol dehydrogenase family)